VESGDERTAPALSGSEEIEFPEIGVLEAFLTDGLRTLLRYDEIPNMKEMTLRYPGHADQVRLLRDMGLFAKKPIAVGGVAVSPIDVTSRLLFPLWKFEPGEEDLTVFRVEIDAVHGGVARRHVFEILDRYDSATATSSMARTTGYVCTALVRLVASGQYTEPGISPPEMIGRVPGCLERVTRDLAARGITLTRSTEDIAKR
jgi:saccharopine dehydrogenase-like NADP-dependent oxidoreductase